MIRSLVAIAFALLLTPLLQAQENYSPVETGKFYFLWLGTNEKSQPSKLQMPDASVEVLQIRGRWMEVKCFPDPNEAKAMWLVAQVRADTPIAKQFLADTKKDKDAYLKEVENQPLQEWRQKRLWINLDQVIALHEIELNK